MPYYAFKPNPKQVAFDSAVKVFGLNAKIEIEGRRLTKADCTSRGCPEGTYEASATVDGKAVEQALSLDWRKSYKLLAGKLSERTNK